MCCFGTQSSFVCVCLVFFFIAETQGRVYSWCVPSACMNCVYFSFFFMTTSFDKDLVAIAGNPRGSMLKNVVWPIVLAQATV